MTYSEDEYNFLCVLFAACRDGLQQHEGFEDLTDHLDVLGKAIFREEELTVSMLKTIKMVLVYSAFILDSEAPNADSELTTTMQNMRHKALQRTIAMLKEKGEE